MFGLGCAQRGGVERWGLATWRSPRLVHDTPKVGQRANYSPAPGYPHGNFSQANPFAFFDPMAYAIVQTSGTQLRVEPGRFYDVNRVAAEEDDTLTLDDVLLVRDGDDIEVGAPLVEGASVTVKVLRHLRGRKIIVYKMRPKKKTRKKQGHRQDLTRLLVESIDYNGKTLIADSTADDEDLELEPDEES